MNNFYKVRNAEGLFLRGPARYRWESNWVKQGKVWGRFAHALAAVRTRLYNAEPEQLAGVVIVEYDGTRERTLPLDAAIRGERFPASEPEHAVTFVFPSAELLNRFIGYMSDGGGEEGFMQTEDGLDFDYHSQPGRVMVSQEDSDPWETQLKEYP